jgi:hypothetical protein
MAYIEFVDQPVSQEKSEAKPAAEKKGKVQTEVKG